MRHKKVARGNGNGFAPQRTARGILTTTATTFFNHENTEKVTTKPADAENPVRNAG